MNVDAYREVVDMLAALPPEKLAAMWRRNAVALEQAKERLARVEFERMQLYEAERARTGVSREGE